jgi:hypothetical protein
LQASGCAADVMISTQLKQTIKSTQQHDYLYNTFATVLDQLFEQHSLLSQQMSVQAGLKMFGHEGAAAVAKTADCHGRDQSLFCT